MISDKGDDTLVIILLYETEEKVNKKTFRRLYFVFGREWVTKIVSEN